MNEANEACQERKPMENTKGEKANEVQEAKETKKVTKQ